MKHFIIIPLIALCSGALGQAKPFKSYYGGGKKSITVEFYKDIEFIGFVFFMGSLGPASENDGELMGNGMSKQEWHAYNFSLYEQYKKYRSDEDLRKVAVILEGADGGDLIRLALQLDDFPNARVEGLDKQYYVDFSPNRNPEEGLTIVTDMVNRLNRLYRTVDFDQYLVTHQVHYQRALEEISRALPDGMLVPAMEKFFQQQFYHYAIMPSLTVPAGMAFGSRYTTDGKTYIFNTFGPFARQRFSDVSNLNLGFEDKEHLRELSTHEFGHSFSNPAVNEIPDQVVKETERLFTSIREAMDNQGYPTWKTCLYEHFVRATEVVIARNLGKKKEADQLLKSYMEKRKFIYLPQIIESMEKYDQNKKTMTYKMAVLEAMDKLKAMQ